VEARGVIDRFLAGGSVRGIGVRFAPGRCQRMVRPSLCEMGMSGGAVTSAGRVVRSWAWGVFCLSRPVRVSVQARCVGLVLVRVAGCGRRVSVVSDCVVLSWSRMAQRFGLAGVADVYRCPLESVDRGARGACSRAAGGGVSFRHRGVVRSGCGCRSGRCLVALREA
jgi:hypothetical protein